MKKMLKKVVGIYNSVSNKDLSIPDFLEKRVRICEERMQLNYREVIYLRAILSLSNYERLDDNNLAESLGWNYWTVVHIKRGLKKKFGVKNIAGIILLCFFENNLFNFLKVFEKGKAKKTVYKTAYKKKSMQQAGSSEVTAKAPDVSPASSKDNHKIAKPVDNPEGNSKPGLII